MYDPERHQRRSVRLREVSYTERAGYFITVCTYERACLFGEVVEGEVRLSALGEIVQEEWARTEVVRPYVALDAFVVMPNHVHGIIGIVGDGTHQISSMGTPLFDMRGGIPERRGTPPVCPYNRSFGGADKGSIPTIMRQFKSVVTKRINEVRRTPGAPVWQRGYWEHIIRNGQDLERIRRYIAENPSRWGEDRYFKA